MIKSSLFKKLLLIFLTMFAAGFIFGYVYSTSQSKESKTHHMNSASPDWGEQDSIEQTP